MIKHKNDERSQTTPQTKSPNGPKKIIVKKEIIVKTTNQNIIAISTIYLLLTIKSPSVSS